MHFITILQMYLLNLYHLYQFAFPLQALRAAVKVFEGSLIAVRATLQGRQEAVNNSGGVLEVAKGALELAVNAVNESSHLLDVATAAMTVAQETAEAAQ